MRDLDRSVGLGKLADLAKTILAVELKLGNAPWRGKVGTHGIDLLVCVRNPNRLRIVSPEPDSCRLERPSCRARFSLAEDQTPLHGAPRFHSPNSYCVPPNPNAALTATFDAPLRFLWRLVLFRKPGFGGRTEQRVNILGGRRERPSAGPPVVAPTVCRRVTLCPTRTPNLETTEQASRAPRTP